MAGTKRSASPAPAASKRRASAQGTITDAFAGPKKAGRGAKASSSTKTKARQLTPDPSSDHDEAPATTHSTPVKKAVDPTVAYPTPSKTPAKALKAAVKEIGIAAVEESEEEEGAKGGTGRKGRAPQPDRLNVKDKKWDQAYWAARAKMGGMDPIHGEGQNRIDQILRVFDLEDDFGPCIGMTRLQRWDRANKLGLDPPGDVRSILLTHEGLDDPRYRENCFHQFSELRTIDI